MHARKVLETYSMIDANRTVTPAEAGRFSLEENQSLSSDKIAHLLQAATLSATRSVTKVWHAVGRSRKVDN